jgi:hypothetical protein
VTVPGANVFYTDTDLSTPPDSEGNRLISCRQVADLRSLYDIAKIARYLARLGEL